MNQFESITNLLTPDYLVFIRAFLMIILIVLGIYYLVNIGNLYIEKNRRINIDLKIITKGIGLILLFFVLRWIFTKYPILGSTLGALIASIVVAYVINPLVNFLQNKSIPRRFGVLIVYVGIVLIFAILIIVVLPRTTAELRNLFTSLPDIAARVSDWFQSNTLKIQENTNLDLQVLISGLEQQFRTYVESFQTEMAEKIRSFASGIYSVFGKVLTFVLVLIFTYYFSVDKDRIKVVVYKNLPVQYKSDIMYLASKINTALMEFIKGKMLLALFVGIFTTIALFILGVDFAIVIGTITMFADIIPYIGPFLGFVPAFLFAVIDSKIKAVWVTILFVFVQWAGNNLLAPKIIGKRTGLHPIVVLLCIVIGGGAFGILGMILSVPLFSVMVILKDFIIMKMDENRQRKDEIRKMR
ncbi:AI-2E family transporter [Peptoniphilus sp. KCTC 25270]|uniref:AI-2E family transporter n=1 Tax=Peptoniphilus sp. KCTC 25270 TaxID=2897414 RepID=UPI001E51B0FB|nr:AI-2E family transporter [Peptoniphilus sp. KCTC 25270]MCD1147178.1 AI-2E family transporter [Peptoniphilus sp. KCTC 25270]